MENFDININTKQLARLYVFMSTENILRSIRFLKNDLEDTQLSNEQKSDIEKIILLLNDYVVWRSKQHMENY